MPLPRESNRSTAPSSAFQNAVASLRATPLRPEITLTEIAAPRGLAAHAFALGGAVTQAATELARGELVLLHDPAEPSAWPGGWRLVAFVRAEVDLSIATDPMLPAVGWSWLLEALGAHGASHDAAAGTVTCASSTRFGTLAAQQQQGATVELRASWSPVVEDVQAHLAAWADLLCTAAGLPPPGVTALHPTAAQ